MKNYTKEEKKMIKEYLKELSENAVWIGEDGNAVCVSSTQKGAWYKFKRLMREDVGESEANEIQLENVGIGWLHLVSELTEEEQKGEIGECEWYIDWSSDKARNSYEVYVLNV